MATDFEKECIDGVKAIAKTLNDMAQEVADGGDMSKLEEYFEDDVYDIEYRVGQDKEYRSVKVMIACGGPNIFVDTKDAYVRLYWGYTEVEEPISYYTAELIDKIFEERYRF